MLKTLKLVAIVGAALVLMGGVAEAAPVPAGTLSIQPLFSPAVSTGGNNITLGGTFAYFSGTGGFSSVSGLSGTTSSSPFTYDPTAGKIILYTGSGTGLAAINGLFVFTDGAGQAYSFNLDTSIQTVTDTITGTGQSIGLYLLGDLVGTGTNVYTATPTAVTLTLNKTGSSAWSFSATLANPPPGSGINVPEPASLTLLGGGLAALSFVRRRKRR
jgi:hypothetical protein